MTVDNLGQRKGEQDALPSVTEQLRKSIEENRPRPYNLDDPAEVRRLHREVRGYLHTCHYKHGTDWEGRKFAIDALDVLLKRAATT